MMIILDSTINLVLGYLYEFFNEHKNFHLDDE